MVEERKKLLNNAVREEHNAAGPERFQLLDKKYTDIAKREK
jgi:hypothetical protein